MGHSDKMANISRLSSLYGLMIVSLYSKKLPGSNAAALASGSGRSFMPQDRHLYFSPSRSLFGTINGDAKWSSFPKKDTSSPWMSDTELDSTKQHKRSLSDRFSDDGDSYYGSQSVMGDYDLSPYEDPQVQIEAPAMDMAKRFGRVQYRSEKPHSQWSQSNFAPEGDSSDILTESLTGGALSSKQSLVKPKGANTLFKMRLFG